MWKESSRHQRNMVRKRGKRVIRSFTEYLGRQSTIGDPPVFDESPFAFTAELEANWRAIRAELEAILALRDHLPAFHELSPDQKRISTGDRWKIFMLHGFGRRAKRNCQHCPQTTQILDRIPRLQNAWFSILAPGYRIPPHRGVTKGLVRTHLGLIVPKARDRCAMRVDDRICHWEEGRCLVFDDTYTHEIWNDTPEERVVLLIDVERPMRFPGRLLSRTLLQGLRHSPYFREAVENATTWEERFDAVARRAQAPEAQTPQS